MTIVRKFTDTGAGNKTKLAAGDEYTRLIYLHNVAIRHTPEANEGMLIVPGRC